MRQLIGRVTKRFKWNGTKDDGSTDLTKLWEKRLGTPQLKQCNWDVRSRFSIQGFVLKSRCNHEWRMKRLPKVN